MASEEVVDEFTVDISKIELIEKYREQIQENFNVEIWYGLIFHFQTGDKQWLNIKGQYHDRSTAKEYIKALCNPEETLGIPFPPELHEIVTNKTLIQKLEKKTRAAILINDDKSELCIQGSDVAVALALSVIEELISGHQKGMMDTHTSPTTYVHQASVRMEQEIRRLWSQDDAIVDDEDITRMPDQVKRAILSCFADNDTDTLENERNTSQQIPNSIGKKENIANSLSEMESHLDNLTLESAVNQDGFTLTNHLRKIAMQNGFTDEEIQETCFSVKDKITTESEFLAALSNCRTVRESAENVSQSEGMWPDPPPVLSSGMQVQNKHLSTYFSQLSKDFVEEDANCSVEEYKRRNAERQKILHKAIKEKEREATEHVQQHPHHSKQKSGKNKRQNHLNCSGDAETAQERVRSFADVTKKQSKPLSAGQPSQFSMSYSRDALNTPHTVTDHSMNTKHFTPQHTSGHAAHSYSLTGSPLHAHGANKTETRGHSNHKFTPRNKHDKQNRTGNATQALTPPQFVHSSVPGPVTLNHRQACSPANVEARDKKEADFDNKRYIVIDGSNVAMTHGNGKVFSCRGIQLCVDYFLKRGHKEVTVFVPNWRKGNSLNSEILFELQTLNQLVFTPSRRIKGKNIACYDDRFIVRLAYEMDGVIVSNDQYRDLMEEKEEWRKIIEERLLQYSFVGDFFMPPDDPLGQDGPSLDEFLCKSTAKEFKSRNVPQSQMQHSSRRLFTNESAAQMASGPQRKHSPWRNQNSSSPFRNQNSSYAPRGPYPKQPEVFTDLKGVPRRSLQMTEALLKQLLVIFPDNLVNVQKVLQNHPCETDLNKLSSYILNID